MSGLADFALTPFSAGLVGGVITGVIAPDKRWRAFGLPIWFACWILLFTVVFAFRSEQPLDSVRVAIGISALWGFIPFVITFAPSCFLIGWLRAYVVSRRKQC